MWRKHDFWRHVWVVSDLSGLALLETRVRFATTSNNELISTWYFDSRFMYIFKSWGLTSKNSCKISLNWQQGCDVVLPRLWRGQSTSAVARARLICRAPARSVAQCFNKTYTWNGVRGFTPSHTHSETIYGSTHTAPTCVYALGCLHNFRVHSVENKVSVMDTQIYWK